MCQMSDVSGVSDARHARHARHVIIWPDLNDRDALEQQIETEQRLEALKTAREKARRRGSLAAATAEPALIEELSRMDVRSS